MKKSVLLFLTLSLTAISLFAQQDENLENFSISFDSGILIGHSNDYYPAPFSTNISVLVELKEKLLIGAGSGVTIIGKTFMPVYADLRFKPFASKPVFLYNKAGWSFCVNKNFSETDSYNYYYGNYPHPLVESVLTKGGFMNELGLGFMLKRADWSSVISIGYHFQQSSDDYTNENDQIRTYENYFNRVAFRVGFIF